MGKLPILRRAFVLQMKVFWFAVHLTVVVVLTGLTQLGGLAWLGALRFRQRLVAFVVIYTVIWGLAQGVAPWLGRVPIPCAGAVLREQSVLSCVLMRNFVVRDMEAVAQEAARSVALSYPGTVTLALDGGFPFIAGFPLLPHLSHDDGEKLDFAFYYRDDGGHYLPGQTRSAIGYFAFETLQEPDLCPPNWLTLRWRLDWLQPAWRPWSLEEERTAALARALLGDPRVGKVFVEPPLAKRLGLAGDKLRFQGCRAARHDDHLHVQL